MTTTNDKHVRVRRGVYGFVPDGVEVVRGCLREALHSLEDGQLKRKYGPEQAAQALTAALRCVIRHCDIHDYRLANFREMFFSPPSPDAGVTRPSPTESTE